MGRCVSAAPGGTRSTANMSVHDSMRQFTYFNTKYKNMANEDPDNLDEAEIQ